MTTPSDEPGAFAISAQGGQAPTFFSDLLGWYSITMLAIGASTGLLDALQQGPGTADELAERAGVDARNAKEWLRALKVAGHVTTTRTAFALTDETARLLTTGFAVNARAMLGFARRIPEVFPQLDEAIRTGRGVSPITYQVLGPAVAAMNTDVYAAALVDEWIAGVPGLPKALSLGARVADIGCGDGAAAIIVATAFPRTHVVGYDLNAALLDRDDLPPNVELHLADARDLPAGEPFNLVLCLDSLHHLGDPAVILEQVRQRLVPTGVLLIAEGGLSGDFTLDSQNPFALITYGTGLLYCLQENLAQDGAGHTDGDGVKWVIEALDAAGFSDISIMPSETGFNVVVGVV